MVIRMMLKPTAPSGCGDFRVQKIDRNRTHLKSHRDHEPCKSGLDKCNFFMHLSYETNLFWIQTLLSHENICWSHIYPTSIDVILDMTNTVNKICQANYSDHFLRLGRSLQIPQLRCNRQRGWNRGPYSAQSLHPFGNQWSRLFYM